ALRKSLSAGFEKKYFLTNTGLLLPGLAISLLSLFGVLQDGSATAQGLIPVLAFVGVITYVGVSTVWRGGSGGVRLGAVLSTLPLAVGIVFALFTLGGTIGMGVVAIFVALIGTNMAFYQWMKSPTKIGAKLLDGIEGFRWYLGVAEKQELDSRYKPESHPELFAAYLPYAVALGLGNAWAQRFAEALTPLQMQQAQPTWYVGSNFSAFASGSGITAFSNGLSSAISSAAVAPGSSGGGFGGSGGGGGGGGGGGW
ncbi:MAG: hypothetical protein WBV39_02115, partial [Rudaea sp.]